ncbi:MAG: STAS domain-containing protein [Proteobacteria bacterium]|nr:STAS domain-containing protein [Pseudomonadota bacterium]MBU1648045.1 STAS domain-containing protein [Pseudomonadota bacterium]
MNDVQIRHGHVCILEAEITNTIKEAMEEFKNSLIDLINGPQIQDSPFDAYLFLDLSPFTIINSSLIGAIGSAIMNDKLQMLALCNVQPTVLDLLQRFGVVSEDGLPKDFSSPEIQENYSKVAVFDSVAAGLSSLA